MLTNTKKLVFGWFKQMTFDRYFFKFPVLIPPQLTKLLEETKCEKYSSYVMVNRSCRIVTYDSALSAVAADFVFDFVQSIVFVLKDVVFRSPSHITTGVGITCVMNIVSNNSHTDLFSPTDMSWKGIISF